MPRLACFGTVLWLLAAACGVCPALAQNDSEVAAVPATYADIVLADQPTLYWHFDSAGEAALQPHAASAAAEQIEPGKKHGKVKSGVAGPDPARFPLFSEKNHAVEFFGDGGRVVFADPGEKSPLDFAKGDAITLEAWVNCTKLGEDQQVYVLGKGRTKNAGFASENQNYALRLRGQKGQACVSFLFRSADNRPQERNDFHRWNTKTGFPVGSGWHHIAVSYTFGDAKSMRGYIDGKKLDGAWDYGGATDEAPVVDDDELWLGSTLGGSPGNTFVGQIDEVALFRSALSDERIAARYKAIAPKAYVTDEKLIPRDKFLVEVFEGIPDKTSWEFPFPDPVDHYFTHDLVFLEVPHKYNAQGVREDRTSPFALRVSGYLTLPDEELQLLLRSRDGVRLYLDDKLVAQNSFFTRSSDGHGPVYPVNVQIVPGAHPLQTGDQEQLIEYRGTGKPQRLTMEIWCGGRGRRPELGETLLATVTDAHPLPLLLDASRKVALDDHSFQVFAQDWRARNAQLNKQRRQLASRDYARYWQQRHARARQALAPSNPPPPADAQQRHNEIDDFVNAKLAEAKIDPLPVVDDWSFLRRVALDTIGIHPPDAIVDAFFALPAETRRAKIIDRLLEHTGWADHWTSYWQDVFAENPNVINPTLNNTGPFRWWIHESMEDNKPLDRFATELILMEGSLRGGGPAGFSMASQNDAPMAAKAHVIAQAFLGMEMKCARCHDAPYHDFTQKQLFSLAAMLKRGPEQLPKTSTVPGDPAALQSLMIKITLKPGEKIPPEWPFAKIINGEDAVDLLQDKADQRQRLAALVTSPHNHRFAQVMTNRVWARLVGRGIVQPVDDWEHAAPTHPELLEFLERRLVAGGYDMQDLARYILNSHTYQRQIDVAAAEDRDRAKLLAGVPRRRLTAEQVVDSLFYAAGKPFNVEDQNIDVDGARSWSQSINLGPVTRSWQFASLSNERDRPSLALPATQNVTDVLEAFGWRASRPDPLTVRTVEPNVLQAAVLENGVVGKRISQLSDDSDFTQLALSAKSPQDYIDGVFQRLLVRRPTRAESEMFTALLTPGFADRIVPDAEIQMPTLGQTGVSWTNHLQPEANERKTALKDQLDAGDPVTARLAPDWRERAEDVVWSLMISPEFVLVP